MTATRTRTSRQTRARERARRPGFFRRLGGLLLGLGLAAAALYAQTLAMSPNDESYVTTSGSSGEEVVTSRFSAKVTKAAVATSVDLADTTVETGTCSWSCTSRRPRGPSRSSSVRPAPGC